MNLSKGQLNFLLNAAWVFCCPDCGSEQKDACNKVEDCILIDWIIRKLQEENDEYKTTHEVE